MSADMFAEGEPNRTKPHWFVVTEDTLTTLAWGHLSLDETRELVSSAIPVEPQSIARQAGDVEMSGRLVAVWQSVDCFVPVSSTGAET